MLTRFCVNVSAPGAPGTSKNRASVSAQVGKHLVAGSVEKGIVATASARSAVVPALRTHTWISYLPRGPAPHWYVRDPQSWRSCQVIPPSEDSHHLKAYGGVPPAAVAEKAIGCSGGCGDG